MPINESLNVPQIVSYINILFCVALFVAPIIAYFSLRRFRHFGWFYTLVTLILSAIITLGFSWFDDYSVQLQLAYYGYEESLVNEFANVAPENMEKVSLLLDCGHVDIKPGIINAFVFGASIAYDFILFMLFNILLPMFHDEDITE